MSEYSNVAQAIWQIFGDETIHYARAYFDTNAVAYTPVEEPLTVPEIIKHLKGDHTLGAYQLLPNSQVNWIAWDIDSSDITIARQYTKAILDVLGEIPRAISWSGGKGYHIFLFLDRPIPASRAKLFAEEIRNMAQVPKRGEHHVEAFPKQAILTESRPHGNLVKLPLGKHPRTHNVSFFVDPLNGWEIGPEVKPLTVLAMRVNFEELRGLIAPLDEMEALVRLLSPVWSSGDRHELALALSGYLAMSGWGMEKAKTLIEDIVEDAGDEELSNRIECVTDTYQALANGRAITGLSTLREMLPGGISTQVVNLINAVSTPDTVRQIDDIRLRPRSPSFLKVRAAVRSIWDNLLEEGTPLQTIQGKKYWYQSSTHKVLDLEDLDWEAYLAVNYGFNFKDAFGSQVARELMLHVHRDAPIMDVHRRSYWDGEKLYLHLDGPQVYILNGYNVQIEYNGECGIMFYNLGDREVIIPADVDKTTNVWDHLVNDISFTGATKETPAGDAEQKELFKLWILAFFFPQLLHVRPMLCMLGAPGSGKTSALRRLLRVIESPSQDVLGLVLDKPDAFRSTLARHKLVILDNLEKTNAPWLVDTLNRILTGSEIELRKLYATNEVERIIPDAFLATTAVSLPFDEETLYSRILPLELDFIEEPVAESVLQRRLIDNRPAIWYSLILELSAAVRSLNEIKTPPNRYAGRLADFTLFAQRMQNSPRLNWTLIDRAIDTLQNKQKFLLREASGFVQALEIWIQSTPEEAAIPHSVSEIWTFVQPLAKMSGLEWNWKSPRALAPHLRANEESLREYYGMRTSSDAMLSHPSKEIKKYSFQMT